MRLVEHPSRDDLAEADAKAWYSYFAPGIWVLSAGILGALYVLVTARFAGVDAKSLDLTLLTAIAVILPILAAALLMYMKPDFAGRHANGLEAINVWLAAVLLVSLSLVAPVMAILDMDDGSWVAVSQAIVYVFLSSHIFLTVGFLLLRERVKDVFGFVGRRDIQAAFFIFSVFLSSAALFRVDGQNGAIYSPILTYIAAPYVDSPRSIGLVGASVVAIVLLAIAWILGVLEFKWCDEGREQRLLLVRRSALVVFVLLVLPVYFDVSLGGDSFHYMTNIGPALHMLHGGRLMNDTFSQYGAGPVLVTALGYLFAPYTFGAAQAVAQVHNLLFYCVWLFCLFRMSTIKLPALMLGFVAIGVVIAGWRYGLESINFAPSVLGMRHLPALLMVLAISCLRPGERYSVFTALAMILAGLWSVEAFATVLGIHLGVVVLIDIRERSFARLARDIIVVVAPVAASVAILAAFAGGFPDYARYFQFLTTYNPLSRFWAIPTAANFFGWIPVAAAFFLVATAAWSSLLPDTPAILAVRNDVLAYRLVPMALLMASIALYYVGRSVDYTLIVAGLPFLALLIPATIGSIVRLVRGGKWLWPLILLPVLISVSVVTFSTLVFFRQDARYRIPLNECWGRSVCSVQLQLDQLAVKMAGRTFIEPVGEPYSDTYMGMDRGMVGEAVDAIERYSVGDATVLLGAAVDYSFLSETVYLYTGIWDRWPRSFTFSDELVPSLQQRILDAPVALQDGYVVIVSRKRDELGGLESGILDRIQSQVKLCVIAAGYAEIDVYKVSNTTC